MTRGKLIIYSGPSGVGKGTVRSLFQNDPALNLAYSISMTTRKPRLGEAEGKDYFFVSRKEFEEKIRKNELLEYAEYVGNYYGTPKDYVNGLLDKGKNVLLEIEVKGAMQVMEKYPEAASIFLVAPSFEELERRIRGRSTEPEDVILRRISKAEEEMGFKWHYEYVVVNDTIERAAEEIKEILLKEITKN